MIISHKNKFAFFRNPKTGSTTAEIMLRMCGVFDPAYDIMSTSIYVEFPFTNLPQAVNHPSASNQAKLARISRGCVHWSPQQAVAGGLITIEQLREYRCYAFIREPFSRCISAFAHMQKGIVYPALMREDARRGYFWQLAGNQQTNYFLIDDELVVEPLYYDDFDNELRRMISDIGGHDFLEIPHINRNANRDTTTPMHEYLAVDTRIILERRYSADFKLYHSMMEKRRNAESEGALRVSTG